VKFPILFKTENSPAPLARLFYVVAANGLFQVRDTETYRAVTPVAEDVPGLLPETAHVDLKFPHLPTPLLEDVLAFFDAVYRRYGGEAIVMLFYAPERQEFRAEAPPQTISGYRDRWGRWWPRYRLDYESLERPPGFLLFGTIHSHASQPAYASATDCDDERFEDGLHVVFGHFNSSYLSKSVSFVANGTRFKVEPRDALEDCAVPPREPRADWMARVTVEEDRWTTSTSTSHGQGGGSGGWRDA
jgi:hypothetical protein